MQQTVSETSLVGGMPCVGRGLVTGGCLESKEPPTHTSWI